MATSDITSLVISVKSDGIREASNALGGLSTSAESATKRIDSLTAAMEKLNAISRITAAATSQTSVLSGALKQVAASQELVTSSTHATTGAMKTWQEFIKGKMGPAMREFAAQGVSHAEAHTKAIRKIADEWKVYKATGVSAQTAVNGVGGNLTASLSASKQKLIEQRREMELYNNTTRAYSAAHAEAIRMNNALDAARRTSTGGLRLHNNAMRESHALARGLSGSLGALWMTYGAVVPMAIGVAIGASLKGIVTIGKDVEHTLEGIRVKGQESVASVNMLRDTILSLGTGVYGPIQVAKAFETLILAGLNAQQAAVGVRDALNLATVGGTTIEKAAEALVTIGTSLGYTAEGYGRVGDVIAKTAAVSLASVDSVAQSFKQASAVGKMYGVSLVDMGVQFAALSNLMVKNTAAGTASKNFYSQLASGSAEVTAGLKAIGLTIKDLKDADGNFKPFVEVMKTLRGPMEDATTGLNKLTSAEQKRVQAMLTNERGNRLFTESLSLIRKAGVETGTALEDMFKKIDESYAFAVVGAIAMSMTIDSQFKSVKNSLDTTLVKAFQGIQPELSLVAARMKAAFNSPEFISGIQALATGAAKLAVFLVENSAALFEMVRALLAFKAAAFVLGMMVSLAEGLVAVKAAFTVARISAIAFQASLGLLGIALAAGAALFVWWATKRDEATTSDKAKAALNYMDDFKSKLDEESIRLENQIRLMKEGKSVRDAETQSMREQQLAMIKLQGEKVVLEAEGNLFKVRGGLTQGQNTAVDRARTGMAPQYAGDKAAYAPVLAAEKAVQDAKDLTNKKYAETEVSQQRLVAASKEVARISDKQAKDALKVPGGTGIIPAKTDVQAANDNYNTTLTRIRGDVEAGKRELNTLEELVNNKFKAGLITEFDKIAQISDGRLKELANEIQQYANMINQAAPANQANARAQVENDLYAAQYNYRAEAEKRASQDTLAFERMEEGVFLTRQKRLTIEGRNEEAAVEKYERLYGNQIKAAQNYLAQELLVNDALESGDMEKIRRVVLMAESLKAMEEATTSGIADGKMTDATDATNKALNQMKTEIDGIIAAVPSGGLFAGLIADQQVDRLKADTLPALKELLETQRKLAMSSNAPGDWKALALTAEEIRKVQKSIGGMDAWTGAQESIRKYGEEAANTGNQINHVMTNAFKSAEDALVSFVQTGKLDFKSLADSIIADMLRMTIRQAMGGAMGAGGMGGIGGLLGLGMTLFGGVSSAGGAGSVGIAGGGVGATNYSLGNGGSTALGSGLRFANGGEPPVGMASLVGENGPEMFVPKTAGTVIPNHILEKGGSGASGNTTVVYSPTITIDSRTDQAQVRQLVSNAVRQGNSELVEQLSRQGRI